MTLPPLHTSSRIAARSGFLTSLALLASTVAVSPAQAAAPGAQLAAVDEGPCGAALLRLTDIGEALGYTISSAVSGFAGNRGHTQLQARCTAGHVEIKLVEERGSVVTIDFSGGPGQTFGLELLGQFPGVGSISRTTILNDADADPMTGSLNFTADTRGESAFVEFNFAGDVLTATGDAELVNHSFAPVLTASATWKDAHVLTFALAGMWHSGVAELDAGLDLALAVAVPTPRAHGVGKSIIGQALACGATTITCVVAAWFPPAAGGCVSQMSVCVLAAACAATSCAD